MNGAPPGVVLRNTGMGASWLAWSIRTEYLPAWRQSNGTLVRELKMQSEQENEGQ